MFVFKRLDGVRNWLKGRALFIFEVDIAIFWVLNDVNISICQFVTYAWTPFQTDSGFNQASISRNIEDKL